MANQDASRTAPARAPRTGAGPGSQTIAGPGSRAIAGNAGRARTPAAWGPTTGSSRFSRPTPPPIVPYGLAATQPPVAPPALPPMEPVVLTPAAVPSSTPSIVVSCVPASVALDSSVVTSGAPASVALGSSAESSHEPLADAAPVPPVPEAAHVQEIVPAADSVPMVVLAAGPTVVERSPTWAPRAARAATSRPLWAVPSGWPRLGLTWPRLPRPAAVGVTAALLLAVLGGTASTTHLVEPPAAALDPTPAAALDSTPVAALDLGDALARAWSQRPALTPPREIAASTTDEEASEAAPSRAELVALAVTGPALEVEPQLVPAKPRAPRRARPRNPAHASEAASPPPPPPRAAVERTKSSRTRRSDTPERMLWDGEVALALGDAEGAYRLATRGRDQGARSDAASLVARSACRIGERDEAKRALRDIPLLERGSVRRDCRRNGGRIGL